MTYTCRMHDGEVIETIPVDSVEIGNRRGLVQFKDGTVHDLRVSQAGRPSRGGHFAWHVKRNIKRDGCKFCYPPPPEPEALPEPPAVELPPIDIEMPEQPSPPVEVIEETLTQPPVQVVETLEPQVEVVAQELRLRWKLKS
jgi:hypothetical protein